MAALTVGAVGAQAVDGVTFQIPPDLSSQQPRVTAATHAALALLRDWFGPLPAGAVTVTATRWQGSDAGTSSPGAVSVPVRAFAPSRDQSMERALISAVAAQYWPGQSPSTGVRDALVAYLSMKAIHQVLEGSNFAAPRFFGGHVSFPLRSVLLSPPVADPRPRVGSFDDEAFDDSLTQRLRALQTIERYVGWPTMLQVIASLRPNGPANWSVAALGERLSEITGIDQRATVRQCFSADVDYALTGMESRPATGGMIETTLAFAAARGGVLPVLVRFADGTTVRDEIDLQQKNELVYTAKSAAVSATIDPDAILLIDRNRDNNAIVRDAPRSRLGVRLALHWLAWLQNTMLSYTAVV
jgi:hypothetical protein